MALQDVTADAVRKAVAEFDRLGRRQFLSRFGFRPATRYFLVVNRSRYDSKAIVGAAHAFLSGREPMRSDEFSGGEATVVSHLRRLGFVVESRDDAPRLRTGNLYKLRAPGIGPAYQWVVTDIRPDSVDIARGWYGYQGRGAAGSDDRWVLSDSAKGRRSYPPDELEVLEDLGVAPAPGSRRGDRRFRSSAPLVIRGARSETTGTPTWRLDPGDTILRRTLHDEYGGKRQGGISPSRGSPNILIFTDPVGRTHGYMDYWDGEVFHYYGEGQRGHQRLTGGNKAVLEHGESDRALRVFQGAKGTVQYLGEFLVDEADPYYWSEAPPSGGGPPRKAIVFRLNPVSFSPSEAPTVLGDPLSRPYQRANEQVTVKKAEPFSVDPTAVERGTQAHSRLQNLLADYAEARGGQAIRRTSVLEPDFDIALRLRDQVFLAEVKSLTPRNETNQLRHGLGQVLHYTELFRRSGVAVKPLLFVERAPNDPGWVELCDRHGVILSWPQRLSTRDLP